jgi:hypothetical protein
MSISKQILPVVFLIIMSDLLARTYVFVPLGSIALLHLHVHIPPQVCVSTSFLLFDA